MSISKSSQNPHIHTTDTLGRDRRNSYTHEASHQKSNKQQQRGKVCGNCGRSHAPKTCPAFGKPCNHCHKLGHYAKFCRSKTKQNKPVNDIEVDSDVSEHGIDTVQSPTMQENEHATLKINNTSVRLKLDSGAETNILTHHDFLKVIPKRQRNN